MKRTTIAMFRNIALLLTGLFICQGALAQIESDKGRFRVDYVAGCIPLEVTITNLWPDQDINVNFHPNGRNNPPDVTEINPTTFTYTYTEPGDYLLEQILALPDDQITTNEDKWDKITISVYEPQAPTATLYRCTNHAVRVDLDTDADNYDLYQVDYGDGTTEFTDGINTPAHSYATGGTYTIRIDGLYAGGKKNCDTFEETITTISQLNAGQLQSATVTQTDQVNGEVQLAFNLSPDISYKLEMSRAGYNSFTFLQDLEEGSTEATVSGLNTLDNYYCFRVVATTGCSDAEVPSNIACTVNLEADAQNDQNVLTWETSVLDFDAFELYRNGELLTTIQTSATRSYTDRDVQCQVNYCYTIRTRNITSTSGSAEVCARAISTRTPPVIPDLAVSVLGDSIGISFIPPQEETSGRAVLLRSQNSGNFLPLDTIAGTSYFDSRLNLNVNEYCYNLRFADECNNIAAPSPVACPMILSLEQSDNEVTLSWNEYFGYEQLDRYIIEQLDETGQVVRTEETTLPGLTLEVDLSESVYYAFRVSAISVATDGTGAPLVAYSNIATLLLEPAFALPTAFTPDGDGLNDRYYPLGTYVESFTLYVYNRWGELVYAEENGTEGWDGTFAGQNAPQGRYTCVVEVKDPRGNVTILREGFMLLRNR